MYKDGDVILIKATVCYDGKEHGNMIRCVTSNDGSIIWVAPSDVVKRDKE